MIPPACTLCDLVFSPPAGGELVYFALTAADAADLARMEANHISGHPPNAAWFCADHLEAAGRLTDQPLSDALSALRSASSR